MKKIINPVPTGGAPWSNDTIQQVLNAEVWNALESTLQYVSDPSTSGNVGVIISGCKVTLNGAGPNYNCSSGIVYMNGQFMAFAGFSNQALPQYVLPASLVNISKVFYNGSTQNLITEQDATVQNSVPGSGQYISLTTTGNNGSPGGKRIENKDITTSWTDFTLNSPWTSGSTPNPGYRINKNRVELRGIVTAGASNTTIVTSLAAIAPALGSAINIPIGEFSGSAFGMLNITAAGALALSSGYASGASFYLDGVSYYHTY